MAIHAGDSANAAHAHLTPIYATSTFTFDSAKQGMNRFDGSEPGYIYSRWGNPTFAAAEQTIAALEAFGVKEADGGDIKLKALLHSSGQAALTTMFLSNVKQGEKILSHYSLYGGTHELLFKVLPEAGIECVIVDMVDLDAVEKAFAEQQFKLVHLETPANPSMGCVDIEAITAIAKKNNCIVCVDNTFATPYLQQPFKYGVDYVVHSTTKFLNGHGSAIGGVLVGRDGEMMNTKVLKWHRLLGGNSNAFDAFLLLQGMKTLELRMDRHCANAIKVAEFLQAHDAVSQVNYAGLPSHANYQVAIRQMKHAGALLSFELKEGLSAGKRFIDRLQMCVRAVSLGTVDTLISHPASMTHFGVKKEEREKYGITDGLIRMSVGIESIDDILEDLDSALR